MQYSKGTMSAQHHNLGPVGDMGALELTNNGELSITFIGSGSAFSKKFFQNNALVVCGENHTLIDCGSRTPEALALLGLSVTDIEYYLITHSHADHIGGLEEVMLVNRYVAKKRPHLIASSEYGHMLWNQSLKGGAAYNERHDGKPLELSDLWECCEPVAVPDADRDLMRFVLGSLQFDIFRTKHIPDNATSWKTSALSYGVVINKKVAYTSDTRFDPDLISFLTNHYQLDAIFHDCQLFTGGVHASLEELATLPDAVKSKMYLMHYGDMALTQPERATIHGFRGFAQQWHTYSFKSRVLQ